MPEVFALRGYTLREFYGYLQGRLYRSTLSPVYDENGISPAVLVSDDAEFYNDWWLVNGPVQSGDRLSKLLETADIIKMRTGNDIYKVNQQYQLTVAYNFIGPGELARRVLDRQIEETSSLLPLGYKVAAGRAFFWDPGNKTRYYLILLVILIIYFICSVLLESLLQPLAVILMIPVSFIGVFLTFYIFGFNFDQGGFASFVLLCGITVNSAIFIVNDFNCLIKKGRSLPSLRIYIKAYNRKIIPVVLTIISTVLGFIPFVWGGQTAVFWFAFAAGTIGGLIFSMVGLVFWFPLFLKLRYD
jgi:multidrug efflux pump subunit AcrB